MNFVVPALPWRPETTRIRIRHGARPQTCTTSIVQCKEFRLPGTAVFPPSITRQHQVADLFGTQIVPGDTAL